jgi:hypothetical protein
MTIGFHGSSYEDQHVEMLQGRLTTPVEIVIFQTKCPLFHGAAGMSLTE